jgi:hypothetical protein
MDSTTSVKVKTTKGEGVGAHSLARNTLGIKRCAGLRDGTRKIDTQFNYTHGPAQTKQ